jgi:hypothetical protein
MNEVMKKIFAIAFAAVLGLGVLSCSKEQFPEGTDMTSLRVALTPEPSAIPAVGGNFEAAVVVNQGPKLDVPWELSVDGTPGWVTASKIRYKSHFTGTYSGDDMDVEQDGVSCTLSANTTGKKRTVNLRFTVADGRSIIYTVTQSAK